MTDQDARLLGSRDGLITAVLVVRREIGQLVERRRLTSEYHVRKLAALDATLSLLRRLGRQFDEALRECSNAYKARQAVEIVSPYRVSAENVSS